MNQLVYFILALDELNVKNIDADTAKEIKALFEKENPGQLKETLL